MPHVYSSVGQRHFLSLSLPLILTLCLPACPMAAQTRPPAAASEDWRSSVPRPVFAKDPTLVALYDKAWEQAWAHVKRQEGVPRSPYMDEACYDDAIWIWDTCFMSLFCRYAPDRFPGIESLDNLYLPLHQGAKTSLGIHIADNPPLFAWVEREYHKFTGDDARLRKLLLEDRFLQKHFAFFDDMPAGFRVPGNTSPAVLRRDPSGFHWNGGHSGMDNTPRGRTGERAPSQFCPNNPDLLWVDALAQQGFATLNLSRLLERVGARDEASRWKGEYERIKTLVNTRYWDERDGLYYDLDAKTGAFNRVPTIASFWPMLAEMASPAQAGRLVEALKDPKRFGGPVPWVTLARSDPDFAPDGNYWRGAVWLPTAYMGIKALEAYGYHALADKTALQVLQHMNATYRTYQPATIWECYHPSRPEPSSEYGTRARPDFCGWSALGPISLFIEHVIGIHDVDAPSRTVRWRISQPGRLGLERLRFGGITADLLHDGRGTVTVRASAPFTLEVQGCTFRVTKGSHRYRIPTCPR